MTKEGWEKKKVERVEWRHRAIQASFPLYMATINRMQYMSPH